MAVGEVGYNPIGYHVGTVWPFDNSFIAWGLRRYGFKEEAAMVAAGILEAAEFFDGRLPEAFGGYPRAMTKYPVQYPTACSPQAWSTEHHCCCFGPCSGSNQSVTTSSSTPHCQSTSAGSSCSIFPDGGTRLTPLDAAGSTLS